MDRVPKTKCPCIKHPRYRAIRVPRARCSICWAYFFSEQNRRAMEEWILTFGGRKFPRNAGQTKRKIKA